MGSGRRCPGCFELGGSMPSGSGRITGGSATGLSATTPGHRAAADDGQIVLSVQAKCRVPMSSTAPSEVDFSFVICNQTYASMVGLEKLETPVQRVTRHVGRTEKRADTTVPAMRRSDERCCDHRSSWYRAGLNRIRMYQMQSCDEHDRAGLGILRRPAESCARRMRCPALVEGVVGVFRLTLPPLRKP
jgi:hypothetical protein